MAPEQLEGREQTVKTDIYSLGLVLYELFTGKKAFEPLRWANYSKAEAERLDAKRHLLLIVKDLDPLVEKVIDRCYSKGAITKTFVGVGSRGISSRR